MEGTSPFDFLCIDSFLNPVTSAQSQGQTIISLKLNEMIPARWHPFTCPGLAHALPKSAKSANLPICLSARNLEHARAYAWSGPGSPGSFPGLPPKLPQTLPGLR